MGKSSVLFAIRGRYLSFSRLLQSESAKKPFPSTARLGGMLIESICYRFDMFRPVSESCDEERG